MIALSHSPHPQANKQKAFAHGFVFAFAFRLSQPLSVRVIAPVQSDNNTERQASTGKRHHGRPARDPNVCTYRAYDALDLSLNMYRSRAVKRRL